MVCVGSKAISPKGRRQNGFIDGDSDDSSPKKRGRKDKGEKPRKGDMVRGKDLLQGNLSMGRLRSRGGAMMGRKGKGEERTVQEAPW